MSRSRVLVLVLILSSTALAGCVQVPLGGDLDAASADALLPRLFDGYIWEYADVEVPVGPTGAITVHVDYWRPDPATYVGPEGGADAPAPVIVDMGPYFSSGKEGPDRRVGHYVHDWIFEEMIPRGYAFAAVETPGTGGSTGCWDFMGPQETAAAAAAVDWLGDQEWSSGKVGMIGKSYDGMTQIMAMSEHPERLATAVPVAPLTHAYAGMHMNGVPYFGFWPVTPFAYMLLIGMAEAPTHTEERMPGYAQKVPMNAACMPENTVFGVGNDGDYNDYYEARDFRAGAADIDVPVFYMQGFLDRNVRADNAFPYVNDLSGDKMVWLGQWAHDYANATWAGRDDMYLQLGRWFDHYLMGVENGIRDDLGFHVQDSEGRWRREATWPAADAAPLGLRLADGALVADAAASGAGAEFLDDAHAFAETGMPRPDAIPLPGQAEWRGEPFAEEAILAAPPMLSLNVSSSGTRGNVVAILWDCADGDDADCTLVTRGAMSLRHRDGLETGKPLVPGETVSVTFALQPRDYVFAAGRVAALTVSGSDADWFNPEPTRNVITISESADAPSTLTLPLVTRAAEDYYLVGCGKRIEEKPCYDPDLKDRYQSDVE